jgi:hypothetical protein
VQKRHLPRDLTKELLRQVVPQRWNRNFLNELRLFHHAELAFATHVPAFSSNTIMRHESKQPVSTV